MPFTSKYYIDIAIIMFYTLIFLRTAILPSENAREKATRAKKESQGTGWSSAAALRKMLE